MLWRWRVEVVWVRKDIGCSGTRVRRPGLGCAGCGGRVTVLAIRSKRIGCAVSMTLTGSGCDVSEAEEARMNGEASSELGDRPVRQYVLVVSVRGTG